MSPAPRVSPAQAVALAERYYGVTGRAERQEAEVDDVFRLVTADGTSRVLRIGPPDAGHAPAAESVSFQPVSFQTALLLYLASAAPGLPVQRVVPSVDGRPEVWWADAQEPPLVRVTSWLDGELLARAESTVALRREVGATLARLNRALRGFAHWGAGRTHRWDLQNTAELRVLLTELPAESTRFAEFGDVRGWLTGYLDRFESVVRPRLAGVPAQVVHTDFHGENLLSDGTRVTGILDFGDALTGPVAMDVGVAACYQLGSAPDVLTPALDVVAGYHAVDPLSELDLELAAEFLIGRLVARIVVWRWTAAREPSDQGYVQPRTPAFVQQLAALRRFSPEVIAGRMRAVLE